MGKQKQRLKRTELSPFNKGFFPNKDFEDIPNGGSADCNHVIWLYSGLRRFPGMTRINSSQVANARGSGIHYFDVAGISKRVATFGNKIYYDNSGTWTDVTGAITISDAAANLVQMVNHQQGSNKYLIGCNGVDAVFKWTGTGNADVLGGSPPIFTSIVKYHDIIWGSIAELVYFSDISDPETWDLTKWTVTFDKTVVRLIQNGGKIAVLMGDHIGSIQGYSYLDVTVEENEITKFGCVGRLAACNATWQRKNNVIAVLAKDGLYIVDETFNYNKIFGEEYIEDFNQSNLSKATVTFDSTRNWLYVAMPYGSATENDYLIIVDMDTGAFWPGSSIHTNNIRAMSSVRDDNGDEQIWFVDGNGYSFTFDLDATSYHSGSATEAISSYFVTKKFDFKDIHEVRDIELLADASGDYDMTVYLNVGLSADFGDAGSINLADEGDLLGTTFTLGASTLGGSQYILKGLEDISGFGRFMQFKLEQTVLDRVFNIRKLEILTKRRRMGTDDK